MMNNIYHFFSYRTHGSVFKTALPHHKLVHLIINLEKTTENSIIICKSVGAELTPIGKFIVDDCHDTQAHPHLFVCLGVGAHFGPVIRKHTSRHL